MKSKLNLVVGEYEDGFADVMIESGTVGLLDKTGSKVTVTNRLTLESKINLTQSRALNWLNDSLVEFFKQFI